MFWTATAIWFIAAGYWIVVLAQYLYLPQMHGPTLVKPRLRRRIADTVMVFAAVCYGIYRGVNDSTLLPLLLPLVLLASALLIMIVRIPRWHLKKQGFVYLMRFVPYHEIAEMRLQENGELRIVLNNGGKITIAFKDIMAVEQAAAFFANEESLQMILGISQSGE